MFRRLLPFTQEDYPIQENTKPKHENCMSIYTMHDTMLVNTDTTSISTIYFVLFYPIISYFIFLFQNI